MDECGLVDVGVALDDMLDVGDAFLLAEFSLPPYLLLQVAPLAELQNYKHLAVARVLRHDLHDVLLAVQFPQAVELAHQLGLADRVGEVGFGIALEDVGGERGVVLVGGFVDFAFSGGVEQLSLVGVVLHAYRCILFHGYINADEEAASKQINLVLLHLDLLLQQLTLPLLLLLLFPPFCLSFLEFLLALFFLLFLGEPSLVFISLAVQPLSFLVVLLGVLEFIEFFV